MFNIGDKVKVTRDNPYYSNLKKGDIVTIEWVGPGYHHVRDKDEILWEVFPEDVEPIKEKPLPKISEEEWRRLSQKRLEVGDIVVTIQELYGPRRESMPKGTEGEIVSKMDPQTSLVGIGGRELAVIIPDKYLKKFEPLPEISDEEWRRLSFKVGDRVIVNKNLEKEDDPNQYIQKGAEGKIIKREGKLNTIDTGRAIIYVEDEHLIESTPLRRISQRKFNIGDEVKVKEGALAIYTVGKTGTIRAIDNHERLGVELDDYKYGYDLRGYKIIKGKPLPRRSESGEWFWSDELELIEKKPLPEISEEEWRRLSQYTPEEYTSTRPQDWSGHSRPDRPRDTDPKHTYPKDEHIPYRGKYECDTCGWADLTPDYETFPTGKRLYCPVCGGTSLYYEGKEIREPSEIKMEEEMKETTDRYRTHQYQEQMPFSRQRLDGSPEPDKPLMADPRRLYEQRKFKIGDILIATETIINDWADSDEKIEKGEKVTIKDLRQGIFGQTIPTVIDTKGRDWFIDEDVLSERFSLLPKPLPKITEEEWRRLSVRKKE